MRVAVLCEESKISEAKNSGAELYNSDILIKDIESGKIKFDKLIATTSNDVKNGKTW